LLSVRLVGDQPGTATIDIRRPFSVQCDFEALTDRYPLHPNLHFFGEDGSCVFITGDGHVRESQAPRRPGVYRSTVTIPGNFMAEGMFSIDVAISTFDPVVVHAHERGVLSFGVSDPGEGDSVRAKYGGPYPGAVRPMLPWKTETLGEVINLRDGGEG
jgi:lipopolysaccharide transport system ATP-binding protein